MQDGREGEIRVAHDIESSGSNLVGVVSLECLVGNGSIFGGAIAVTKNRRNANYIHG